MISSFDGGVEIFEAGFVIDWIEGVAYTLLVVRLELLEIWMVPEKKV